MLGHPCGVPGTRFEPFLALVGLLWAAEGAVFEVVLDQLRGDESFWTWRVLRSSPHAGTSRGDLKVTLDERSRRDPPPVAAGAMVGNLLRSALYFG